MRFFTFLFFTIQLLTAHEYEHVEKWPTPPKGLEYVGNSHGEIAVDKTGLIYVSVLGGKNSGVQVYNDQGEYVRTIENSPKDLHGFVIHDDGNKEYIYGATLYHETVIKMTLDGKVVLEITKDKIPLKFHKKKGKRNLTLSSVAVGPNGDIYVVDGYGLDYIHRFDKLGNYISTFGGREAPYKLNNCHKIFMDHRYKPSRLLCTNRNRGTLVHMTLEGEMIGVHAKGLRKPSSVDFRGEQLVVAEIEGRIALLDLKGEITKVISFNNAKYRGNQTKPKDWKKGQVITPHGIAFDKDGNILITEYSLSGRILRYDLSKIKK